MKGNNSNYCKMSYLNYKYNSDEIFLKGTTKPECIAKTKLESVWIIM